MRSVLGSVGSRRRSTTSTALLNASAFGLRGYVDTPSLLVDMHLLDRSCMIVGNFFEILRSPTVTSEPGLCVDVICASRTQRVLGDNSHMLTSMSYFDSAVLLDEAAQTNYVYA